MTVLDKPPLLLPKADEVWASLTGPTARKSAVAVVDQGILSATNFFTGLMLARLCSKEEFGAYALAFAVMVTANGLQGALVTGPMTVLGAPRVGDDWRRHATTMALAQAVLGLGLVVVTCAVSAILLWSGVIGCRLGGVLLAMSGALFFIQAQEFCRRILYTRLRAWRVLLNDACCCTAQVAGLLLLWRLGGGSWRAGGQQPTPGLLNSANAFLCLGAGAVAGTMLGLWQVRYDFIGGKLAVTAHLRETWSFGKWGLISAVAALGYNQSVYYILGAIVGTEGVALFEGPRIVVAPCILIAMAWSNVVGPILASRYAKNGFGDMVRFLKRASAALMVCVTAILIIVVAFPHGLLSLIVGDKYAADTSILLLWCPTVLLICASTTVGGSFYATRHPELGTMCRALSGILGVILILLFTILWGVVGAATGRLLAEAIHALAILFFARNLAIAEREKVKVNE